MFMVIEVLELKGGMKVIIVKISQSLTCNFQAFGWMNIEEVIFPFRSLFPAHPIIGDFADQPGIVRLQADGY